MINKYSSGGGGNITNPIDKKGKTIKIISIIILLILIVISISFALGNIDINLLGRRNIKISKCELDINFKESEELMLVSKYPISKEEALKYKAKEITITNNSTCDTAYYKVTIKDLVNSSINKDKINYQVIDKSTNKETIDKNPDNFNISDSLTKGNTKTYTIRLWIDESATNTDLFINGDTTKPIEYKYALNIESSDEELKGAEMTATEFAQANVGAGGLEPITHEIDDTLQVDSNFATEYRYRGGDSVVKNYVTFNNEIWRIIGVIPTEDTNGNVENRFKIIRDTSIWNTKWNINGENDWTTATLNTYLNNDYYNTLTSDAKNMIGTTKYYLGGYNDVPSFTSDVMWQYERKNEANRTGYYYGTNPIMQNDANKKIAIMYASDYGYAASKECSKGLGQYAEDSNCKTTNNWLDKSQDTWLLMPFSDYSAGAFEVFMSGSIYIESLFSEAQGHVYPVLSLSSNVKISGGEGTSSSPYTLSVK